MANEEVDWDRLDKRKFFGYGAAMFSGVTTLLYPLHVIKTRQMALPDVAPGLRGTWQTISSMWTADGVRGFYRGYGTSVLGFLPARMVYLASLEVSKSTVAKVGQKLELSEPVLAGVSNFAGGASASLATQSIAVPLDVISQRQMVYSGTGNGTIDHVGLSSRSPTSTGSGQPSPGQPAASTSGRVPHSAAPLHGPGGVPGSPLAAAPHTPGPSCSGAGVTAPVGQPPSPGIHGPSTTATPPGVRSLPSTAAVHPGRGRFLSGLQVGRSILAAEGVAGLYRGFGMSVVTVVPSSAIWWAAYGAYQKMFWRTLDADGSRGAAMAAATRSGGFTAAFEPNALMVQSSASVCAGLTAGVLTNPLDLIKTRIQVAGREDGKVPTFKLVLGRIIAEDGWIGLWRGVVPRMANSAIWGTAMVGIYEALKRLSKKSIYDVCDPAAF